MAAATDFASQLTTADWHRLLARAIDGEGVRAVFQPIVDLERGVVAGYEALTRFDLPDGQSVAPDAMFGAAARAGVGAELDARTLTTIFEHRSRLPSNCFLSVNIEPNHLLDPGVRDVFTGQGALRGVVVEFTEHHEWDWQAVETSVQMLRSSGASIAIDDAGAGHSGLQQILRLRPSILKLDRTLIEGIDRDEAKASLVEMMGVFANRVDAWVLAEGVETAAEARRLFDLEVPLVQGYFFGRPNAPWAELIDEARGVIDGVRRQPEPGDTLRPLTQDEVAVERSELHRLDWSGSQRSWTVVVDASQHPIGVVDAGAVFDGEVFPAVVANIDSDPAEVAQRISAAESDPWIPVVATDDFGRYVGIVTVRRLLGHLAQRST